MKCVICGKECEKAFARGTCSNTCYQRLPEVKQRKKEYDKEYNQKPEVKQRKKEYDKEYYQKPEVKQRMKEYNQKPEVKQKAKEYMKEYYQKPEVKQRMRGYVAAGTMAHDFENYFARLLARTKPARRAELLRNKGMIKLAYVSSVDTVIDGGLELKVADRLGVKYKAGAGKKGEEMRSE